MLSRRQFCYSGLMASEPLHRISVEEYLALERRSETKSEYLNGEIFAMAGASRFHNRIVLNLGISLDGQLKNRGCEIFVNDMRVSVPAADLITYPDVVVSCDNPQFADEEVDTLLNPTLIIEVFLPARRATIEVGSSRITGPSPLSPNTSFSLRTGSMPSTSSNSRTAAGC